MVKLKPKLLLTQPQPERIQQELIRARYHCDCLPLLKTVPLPPNKLKLSAQLRDADLVVVASPAAASWLALNYPHAPDWLDKSQRWYTPGSGTAALLLNWKITANYPRQQHNAAAMLSLIPPANINRKLLWIGSYTKLDTRFFVNHAIDPTQLVSHTAIEIMPSDSRIRQYANHHWIISSSKTLAHAIRLWKKCHIRPPLVVTSARLGRQAHTMGYTRRVAASIATRDLIVTIMLDYHEEITYSR